MDDWSEWSVWLENQKKATVITQWRGVLYFFDSLEVQELASSQLEEGLMACCCCVTPEGDEEVSGRRRWRLSECLERFSVSFLETAGKVLANGTGSELASPTLEASPSYLYWFPPLPFPFLLKEQDCWDPLLSLSFRAGPCPLPSERKVDWEEDFLSLAWNCPLEEEDCLDL